VFVNSAPNVGILVPHREDPNMPRKYQNGKLEIRKDVARPYYFVRVTRPTIRPGGFRSKRRVAEALGFLDQISKKRAMGLRAKLLEEVNAHRMVAQSQMVFRDVATRFIDVRVPQLGVAVQKRYPSQIKVHLIPAFGDLKMGEIDTPSVEEWLHSKEQAGFSQWTVKGLKGVLSAIFTRAKVWKLWDGDNPCEGIKVKGGAAREKRSLADDQLRTLLVALDERERFLIQILYGVGLRISEALGLKWCDLDLEGGTVTIRRRWYRGDLSEETKSPAGERILQLGSILTDEFKRRYPGPHKLDAHVFIGDDGRNPPDDRDLLREYFRPIVRRLGLYYVGFGWHAFRRKNISARQHAGATPLEAMRAAGHNSVDMTLLYTLSDADRERTQVDAMFDGLMKVDGMSKQ
jgi:integrase